MSGACLCPDVDVPLSPIPSGPLTCGCCGEPLELTCAGKCGEEHVRGAFAVAVPSYVNTGRAAPPRERTPPRGNWICGRCEAPIPKKRGRSPLYCLACRTPEELARLEMLAAQNKAARQKRLEAAS